MNPKLRNIWWNCEAKEVNRQPRAMTRPPMTPVKRVDLRRQTPMVKGDRPNETDTHIEPSHTEIANHRN